MAEQVAVPAPAAAPPPPPPAAAAPAAPAVAAPVVPVPAPAKPAEAAAPVVPAPEVKPPAPAPVVEPVKPAAPAAPVEIEVKLPDGSSYDPEAIGEFKKFAVAEGFTPKQAQALLDFDTKMGKQLATKVQKATHDRVEALRTKDIETLKADPKFGGAQYDLTVAASKSAMKQFFGEAGSKILVATGLDNHPDIVRGLAIVRKAIAEDTTTPPTNAEAPQAAVKPQSLIQRGAAGYAAMRNKKK